MTRGFRSYEEPSLAAILLIWLTAVLLSCVDAFGQVYLMKVTSQDCSTLRFGCRLVDSYGSCVAIGRYNSGKEILLTAKHCLEGAQKIEVLIDRRWVRASHLGSGNPDLSLIGLNHEPLPCLTVAEQPARIGEAVTLAGYPRGGAYRAHGGSVAYNRFQRFDLQLNVSSVVGDSGGAVIADKKLVGIISSTNSGGTPFTLASGVAAIRKLIIEDLSYKRMPDCGVLSDQPVQPSPTFDREIVRSIIREELRVAISEISVPGEPGPRGPPGERGPKGDSYDPGEIADIRQRLSDLENREPTVIEKPRDREIVINVIDSKTGERITKSVRVPPDKNVVDIPITRLEKK